MCVYIWPVISHLSMSIPTVVIVVVHSRGKSTLLRLLAKRQLPVPDNLDVLLVEQEVVGTELTALQVRHGLTGR